MQKKLLVATHNAHKTGEIRKMLDGLFGQVVDLTELADFSPAVEDGATFAENSAIKALAASRKMLEAFVLSDDSGLEVDALGGDPGIHSARYAGEEATDADNREKLLDKLGDAENRAARFRCVVTVANGGAVLKQFDGTVEGRITREVSGDGGFGYDPIFIPEGEEQTFAELAPEVKNSMSHRGRAIEKFREWLVSEIG